jgi:hypothetical protein
MIGVKAPRSMRADPVHLRCDDPEVFGPLRDLHAAELLHSPHVSPVPCQGVQVVHPAHVGQVLGKGLHLAHLLVHAVDVPQNRIGPEDVLAVQFQHDPEHAVGGRVLRAHVEDQGVLGRPGLQRTGIKISGKISKGLFWIHGAWPDAS